MLVVQFSAERLGDYQKMARQLRAEGIGVEVYPEAKKVGQQFKYAEQRGFRVALIAGPDEFAQGVWKVKDLAKREETTVATAEVVAGRLQGAGRLAATRQGSVAGRARCVSGAATTARQQCTLSITVGSVRCWWAFSLPASAFVLAGAFAGVWSVRTSRSGWAMPILLGTVVGA